MFRFSIETRRHQESDDGFAVLDFAARDSCLQLFGSEPAAVDPFVVHVVSLALREVRGEKDGHLLFNETGAGIVTHQFFPGFGAQSGFLAEFALRGLECVFAIIDLADGDFPHGSGSRAGGTDAPVIRDADRPPGITTGGARMSNDGTLDMETAGIGGFFLGDMENAAAVLFNG